MSANGTSASMAAVASSSQQDLGFTNAELLLSEKLRLPPAINTTKTISEPRSGHLNLDTFSPVNQNGSFEFDRVLKSGEVYKRTKNTKQWKKYYLVLRPNLLSVYKNPLEDRLHKQISLSELNAVALVKDRRGRREHLFGLYTPARNYHLQASDDRDAKAWVDLIRREARIEEGERGIYHVSPLANDGGNEHQLVPGRSEQERFASSSPEPIDVPGRPSTTRDGIKIPGVQRPSTHNLDYSGDDMGYSDWSDAPYQSFAPASQGPSIHRRIRPASGLGPMAVTPSQQASGRNASHSTGFPIQEEERVIWHGHLLILKSKSGVRQWKKVWAVLRPKNLAFYKTEEEYAALLIIPLSNIINAVEIDPVSRSKSHCMQIIAEERNMRLCAPSEEALARWLGALKSRLALRRERRKSTAL
ncbi:MAG: hypothetical protein Q9220_005327 [cf. Caloplaca sp. 1 TL-2023]